MFDVERNGTKVVLHIQTDLPGLTGDTEHPNTVLVFRWECQTVMQSELLTRYLRQRINDAVTRTRQAEYEAGFKDGRGKKKRREWFSRLLDGKTPSI